MRLAALPSLQKINPFSGSISLFIFFLLALLHSLSQQIPPLTRHPPPPPTAPRHFPVSFSQSFRHRSRVQLLIDSIKVQWARIFISLLNKTRKKSPSAVSPCALNLPLRVFPGGSAMLVFFTRNVRGRRRKHNKRVSGFYLCLHVIYFQVTHYCKCVVILINIGAISSHITVILHDQVPVDSNTFPDYFEYKNV